MLENIISFEWDIMSYKYLHALNILLKIKYMYIKNKTNIQRVKMYLLFKLAVFYFILSYNYHGDLLKPIIKSVYLKQLNAEFKV